MSAELAAQVIRGAYWLSEPADDTEVCLVCSGPVIQEVLEARDEMLEDLRDVAILVITSSDRLHSEWIHQSKSPVSRSEEHTSELQSRFDLVCRLLLEKKKKKQTTIKQKIK